MTEFRHFTCNLCEALCGLNVAIDGGRPVEIRGNPEDVFSRGHICPKGAALREFFDDPDRLRTPMRRTAKGFEPVSWDEAMDEASKNLRRIRAQHGPDAVALYVGNPTAHSHRAAFGSQALTTALGTKNRFDPNSQDSNPRLFACMQVYGDGLAMAVPDIDRTDYFLIMGANPAASNGSQMGLGDPRGRLKSLRARGARVVVVDPRRTETVQAYADRHLFIRPGGDAAFLLAILHVLFAEGRINKPEVSKSASGLAELEALAARFSPEGVAGPIGVAAEDIRTMARELAATPRGVVYARVGTCQNEFGPLVSWLAEATNIVTGHINAEGCAMFPEPAADVGPLARLLIGNNFGRWRSRVRGLPEFIGALPSAVMAEEMETPGAGQIRALVNFAGNPVLSTPNGPRLAKAIQGLEYFVAVDPYINETNRLANLILPPAHVFQSGNFDLLLLPLAVRNVAKYSPPILPKGPNDRDDWEILTELAARIRLPSAALRRLLLRATRDLPEIAIDLLLRMGRYRLSLRRLAREPNGMDLGPLRPKQRYSHHADGLARLAPPVFLADIPRLEAWLAAERPSLTLIGRRHMRSNNSWMHNLTPLVKGPSRASLLMNPADAKRLGLREGMRARVSSRAGKTEAIVSITAEMMPGVVSLPHGFGHQEAASTLRVAGALAGSSANALTDENFIEPLVGTSILNGVPVTIESSP